MPSEVREFFKNSAVIDFDIREEYARLMKMGARTKDVLDKSIHQHASIIIENADDHTKALELLKMLDPDIKSRVKHYSYCISRSTENYLQWMRDEYTRKLSQVLRQHYA
jgi:hypothetical protein